MSRNALAGLGRISVYAFKGHMDIQFIHQPDQFGQLQPAWDALVERSATNVPFLRHSYLQHWWSTLGGGEWDEGELWIAVGRVEGRVRGIAPLFRTRSSENEHRLMFLGSIEISDYLDVIAAPDDVDVFSGHLLDALSRQRSDDWQVLDLYNLPDASPSRRALAIASRERGWGVAESTLQPCPAVVLPSSWEDYLAGLEKKYRHEIRRKLRRAGEIGLTFQVAENRDAFKESLEGMLALMRTDVRKAAFLQPAMETQFRRSMRSAFDEGWLQLAMLKADGILAAAYLNFDDQGKLWVYNSAINPEFFSASAGWVLLAHLIRWGIEHDRSELDFMRGDEPYKYRFGGVDRAIFRLRIQRPA